MRTERAPEEIAAELELQIDLALEESNGRITPWIAEARCDLWYIQAMMEGDGE